jgi:hypothetical protein
VISCREGCAPRVSAPLQACYRLVSRLLEHAVFGGRSGTVSGSTSLKTGAAPALGALIPQSGGFEGLVDAPEGLNPNDAPVSKREPLSKLIIDRCGTSGTPGAAVKGDNDLVASVIESLRRHAVRVKGPGEIADRSSDVVDPRCGPAHQTEREELDFGRANSAFQPSWSSRSYAS